MYLTIAVFGAIFFLFLFSQFGSRLPSRHALVWGCVALFVLSAALFPEFYQRLAHFLGVSLASNLIFAGLILLLIFLLVEQSAEHTRDHRLLRELATQEAARTHLATADSRWADKPGPKVLVVLPAYNEVGSIDALLRRLERVATEVDFSLDYCFIDDGSQDGTGMFLEKNAPQHLARHPLNMGVAAALLTGMKIGKSRNADWIVQCDADGQHPVEKIPGLLAAARQLEVDLLIGSRYAKSGTSGSDENDSSADASTPWRRAGGWLIALALKGFRLPSKITDPTSGFRAYSRRALDFLSSQMPEEYPEPEIIALLAWKGMKVAEIRVPMAGRQEGVSTIRGVKTLRYMSKVLGALMGLRLRTLNPRAKSVGPESIR